MTIYPIDHRPAHVQVIGQGVEAVFKLNCPQVPPVVRENHGFARQELSRVAATLTDKLAQLCEKWSEIHGNF